MQSFLQKRTKITLIFFSVVTQQILEAPLTCVRDYFNQHLLSDSRLDISSVSFNVIFFWTLKGRKKKLGESCSLSLLCSIPLLTAAEAIWLYLLYRSFFIVKTGVYSRRS